MTSSKDKRIPTSIVFDPVACAKYNSKRDYYYHEDPVYRKHVLDQHDQYIKNHPEKIKKYPHHNTLTPEQYQKYLEQHKKYYRNKKEYLREYCKAYNTRKPMRSKLDPGLELREESD